MRKPLLTVALVATTAWALPARAQQIDLSDKLRLNGYSNLEFEYMPSKQGRGDANKTVDWLERAPAHDIFFMLADPLILRLRDDPRLIAFCRKTGLPPPGESEALSIDQIRAADSTRRL